MKRILPGAVVVAAIAVASASAQETAPSMPPAERPGDTYHGRLGQLEVRLPKTEAEVDVDGRLDDAAWNGAAMLTGFSQYQPVDRLPADDSTEVLVVYTDHAMYFGIRAFEPHGSVVATLADRDRIGGNDHVQLILDTFNDRRRALLFSVNPLGVQSDGTFTDGSGTDLSPDFLYESKGRVTDGGYEIELRIPFKSIRYQQTAVQQWGVQVVRRVMHSGHEQTWTPAERGAPSFLTQSGTFVDLTELRRGLVLDVNPVMTARSTGAPASAADGTWQYDREDPEFGGTVRWGVTPNVSLNATANPDFSQVEAD
ncbi:MAG: carbohydrate binding family 9 domain-containing protein, partial [Longimicrobiales bacterium]